jgi:hypothetical protein
MLFVELSKDKMEIVFLVTLVTTYKMEDVLLSHLMQDIKILINIVLFGMDKLVDNVPKVLTLMLIEYALQLILIVLQQVHQDNV